MHLWRTVLQRCCQISNPSRRCKSLRVKRYEEDATRTWLRGLQSSYDLDVTVNPPAMKWQAIRVPSVCGLRPAHLFSVRKQDGWTILRQVSRNTGKTLSIFLLAMVMSACRQSAQKPVTLSYFRLGWAHADVWSAGAPLSQKFTRETGIQLKDLPVPENALDQLDLSRTLLKSSSGPDVLSIDLISSGVLAPDLVDLRP